MSIEDFTQEKPNLNNAWETWLSIGLKSEITSIQQLHQLSLQIIKSKIYPMITALIGDGLIKWYCFLIHGRNNDPNLYFHIRFEPQERIEKREEIERFLPEYCEHTKTFLEGANERNDDPKKISDIDESLFEQGEIEEAWRIIGEQSGWIMKFLNAHKNDVNILDAQFVQFLHFFTNMVGLGNQFTYRNIRRF
ncbi:MAG: hypothetical protein NWE91_05875 [Candidatus Bathyarchaeota archaeon]|nr:hypothetical protein [Candidatus Bathyarchaeota archaeon]